MRILLMAILLFTCAPLWAQVNFVQNPDFETYSTCPDDWNQVYKATGWRNARDSAMEYGLEYYNECGNAAFDRGMHIPDNTSFFQYAHSGGGMAGGHFFYDKNPVASPLPLLPFNYRDYLQGHLALPLTSGKTYCVSFWVNLAEASGYGQNKIGAYLDNGAINISTDTPGAEILTVSPQIYTNDVLADTGAWIKIEGSFIASGAEDHITIGNFFPNSTTTTVVTDYYHGFTHFSYYLIDDVSVTDIDLSADAGPDNFVEETKEVQIGRVGDTTAKAIDCKWYHKGTLIDSGAVISVQAGAKGAIDTYTVVQTICGNVKTDTVVVYTVGLGMKDLHIENEFTIYPNPSTGKINISGKFSNGKLSIRILNFLGQSLFQQSENIIDHKISMNLSIPSGSYMMELVDECGHRQWEKLLLR